MGRYSYPHVIENGAGEHITFVRVVPGPAGDRLEVENILYASTKRNGGRPSLFVAAFLMGRYRSEFGMLEIPMAVQRFLFPVLVTIGRRLGKYRRYADAPEPVRRPA